MGSCNKTGSGHQGMVTVDFHPTLYFDHVRAGITKISKTTSMSAHTEGNTNSYDTFLTNENRTDHFPIDLYDLSFSADISLVYIICMAYRTCYRVKTGCSQRSMNSINSTPYLGRIYTINMNRRSCTTCYHSERYKIYTIQPPRCAQ